MKKAGFAPLLGAFALVFALWTAPGAAQAAMPDAFPDPPVVTGMVTDSSGAPLGRVQVAITSLRRTTMTDARGRFAFDSIPPGTYRVDASLVGYAPARVPLTISGGEPAALVIRLAPAPLALQGLVVTGTPGAIEARRAVQATTQLAGDDFDRDLRATVAQTLSKEPGIQMRYNGPAASTPVIRGLSGNRVLVLENGERTGDLSGAAPDHGLSIDPLSATRMEVVRGPASILYGSGAIGGVVNVIDEDIPATIPRHVSGFAAIQGESVNPGGGVTAKAVVPLTSVLAVSAAGGFRHVDDVRVGGGGKLPNTYLHNDHGDVGVGYVGDAFSGGMSYGDYAFDYGLPSPTGDPEGGAHIRGRRRGLDGRATLPGGVRFEGTAQWYEHDEIEKSGAVGTSFGLNTQTADVKADTRWGVLSGTVGASALFEQYDATGEEALTPAANTDNVGLFIFQQVPLGPEGETTPHFQVGLREDLYRITSEDGGEAFGPGRALRWNAFSGSVGVNAPVTSNVSLSVNAARAFRAPAVEELFSNAFHAAVGSFQRGNPDLDPEINEGIEGVLHARTARLDAQGALYYNRITDYIAPLRVGDTVAVVDGSARAVPLDVFSQALATLRGMEGKIQYRLDRGVSIGVNGDFVRGEFEDDRGPLPYMPPARLGGLLRWEPGAFSIEADLAHAFAQNRVTEHETPTAAYDLVNLSFGYNRTVGGRIHRLTLRVDNVLDERYYDATSRIKDFSPNPGRNVSLVYRVLF